MRKLLMVLGCLLAVVSPARAEIVTPPLAALPGVIAQGDMAALIPHIVAIYEDAGLSWDPSIDWQVGPYTTSYWYYDHTTYEILVGAMPHAAEIADYWQNWSNVLTDSNWRPEDFFADATEAAELAAFNQFVLATHESAHAITYRYDYDHLDRHQRDINCREYYADRLTAAILAEAARQDADMARWRLRYRDLVAAMAETIPAQYRLHIPSFAALDADCALIYVEQPTPDTMQPYASAFFERWRVLLDADLPPLAEVLKVHLADRFAEALGEVPRAAEAADYVVETQGPLTPLDLASHTGDFPPGETSSQAAAFAPDGVLYRAALSFSHETGETELSFGSASLESVPLGPLQRWPHPSVRVELSSIAAFGPDRFVGALVHWERDADDNDRHFVTWLAAQRLAGVWTIHAIREIEGAGRGLALRSSSSRLYLFDTPDELSGRPSARWRGVEIDPADFAVLRSATIGASILTPLAVDDRLRVYSRGAGMLWRSGPDGEDVVLVGSGLSGPRDGAAPSAEFGWLQLMQWIGEDAVLVDRGRRLDHPVLRRLHRVADR